MGHYHKKLCYFFGVLNIVLYTGALVWIIVNYFEAPDEPQSFDYDGTTMQPELQIDDETFQAVKIVTFFCFAFPAIANICLAELLIIGVYKRRPRFVQVFRMLILMQMVLVSFSFVFALVRDGIMFGVMNIALFAVEGWIAGDYYKIQLEEIRQEMLSTAPRME